ncbi:MAG: hypothetical protein AAF549_01430 [Pseudomonadota bacterium]
MQLTRKQREGFEDLSESCNPSIFQFISLIYAWEENNKFIIYRDPYLVETITDVIYLDKEGKRLREPHNAAPKKDVDRIIVQFEHIEIEHKKSKSKDGLEQLVARNLQFNLSTASNQKDSILAMQEKAKAATSLARFAKASGWKSVDINSDDPYDRFILALACDGLGIKHNIDAENIDLPIPPLYESEKEPLYKLKKEISKAVKLMNKRSEVSFEIDPPTYSEKEIDIDEGLNDLFGDNSDGADEDSKPEDARFGLEVFDLGTAKNNNDPSPGP